MKRLFCIAEKYLEESDWKDLAMIKICLFSMGILAGMKVAEKDKKAVTPLAGILFVMTYVPLMAKFFGIVMADRSQESV